MPGEVLKLNKDIIANSVPHRDTVTAHWNQSNAGQGVVVLNAFKDYPNVGEGDLEVLVATNAFYKWTGSAFVRVSTGVVVGGGSWATITGLPTDNGDLVTYITGLISALDTAIKGGVAADGDTLAKLRGLISNLENVTTTHTGQINAINTLLTSDDVSLDTLQEIVDFIQEHEADITSLLSTKVNKADVSDQANAETAAQTVEANRDNTKWLTARSFRWAFDAVWSWIKNQSVTFGDDVILNNDSLKIGNGTPASNKKIFANNGDANLPAIQFNEATNSWQYSNDGTTFSNMSNVSTAFPNTYFVSPSGNDSTGLMGDITRPYTPAGAVALAVAGDTIGFLPGAYTINTNIAKFGVNYVTVGGRAKITVSSAAVTLFDYDALASSALNISIKGDFEFILNGANSNIIRIKDQFGSGSVFISVTNVQLITGNAFIITGKDNTQSSIEFSAVMETGYTGMIVKPSATNAVGAFFASNFTANIINKTASQAISSKLSGFNMRISYYSTSTGGLTDSYLEDGNTLTLLMYSTNANAITYLGRNNVVRAYGGKLMLQLGTLTGQFDTTTIETSNSNHAMIQGYFLNTVIKQNGTNSLDIDGISSGCTLQSPNARTTTLKGVHANLTIADSATTMFDRLLIYGDVSLSAASKIYAFNIHIYGILSGNAANGLVQLGFGNHYVKGSIRNTSANANARCIEKMATNSKTKLTLDRCTLETGGTYSIYQLGSGVFDEIELKMLGVSYSNKGIGNAGGVGFSYSVGSAADLIVDADISAING